MQAAKRGVVLAPRGALAAPAADPLACSLGIESFFDDMVALFLTCVVVLVALSGLWRPKLCMHLLRLNLRLLCHQGGQLTSSVVVYALQI